MQPDQSSKEAFSAKFRPILKETLSHEFPWLERLDERVNKLVDQLFMIIHGYEPTARYPTRDDWLIRCGRDMAWHELLKLKDNDGFKKLARRSHRRSGAC